MIFDRQLKSDIINWYHNRRRDKCLFLVGGRQTGKTTICSNLLSEWTGIEKKFIYYMDLSRDVDNLKEIFKDNSNVYELLGKIKTHFPGKELVENHSMIVLDEIQLSKDAYNSIKMLVNCKKYAIIAAASTQMEFEDYHVGFIDEMVIWPLTFFEYYNVVNDQARNVIKKINDDYLSRYKKSGKSNVDNFYHKNLCKSFIDFMLIGGMPEVIKKMNNSNSMFEELVETNYYTKDINSLDNAYKNSIKQKLKTKNEFTTHHEMYSRIHDYLCTNEGVFKISAIGTKSYRSMSRMVNELKENYYVLKIPCLEVDFEYLSPTYSKESMFQLYLMDSGFIVNRFNNIDKKMHNKLLLEDHYIKDNNGKKVKDSKVEAIIKNTVVLELIKNKNRELYFYKTPNDTIVDFVVSDSEGNVCALVIEYIINNQSKLLRSLHEIPNNKFNRFIKITMDKLYVEEIEYYSKVHKKNVKMIVEHIPFYMISLI